LVEYGMLVGLIAVICVVAVTTLGAEVSTAFSGGRWIRTLGPAWPRVMMVHGRADLPFGGASTDSGERLSSTGR
jgi:hypothetical protein